MTPQDTAGTLVLSRRDVAHLLGARDCIDALDTVLRLHASGGTLPPGVLGMHVEGGGFHVKAAGVLGRSGAVAVKVNANFPDNPARRALPTIQGAILLFEAEGGRLLAVLDSIEITGLRTAAATAIAARHLARADADAVTICGCGAQSRHQLRALSEVRRLRRVFAVDADGVRAARFASEMARELGLEVTAAAELRAACRQSDIIVTCTPSARWILGREDVVPGTFVAAVGADNPHKQEIEPALLASSTVVADVLEQCLAMGDLHHAVAAGLMAPADVRAELAEVVAGLKPGRERDDEVIVFDSTGSALQDVATAVLAHERARAAGRGLRVDLGA